jgi:hypothetical protein
METRPMEAREFRFFRQSSGAESIERYNTVSYYTKHMIEIFCVFRYEVHINKENTGMPHLAIWLRFHIGPSRWKNLQQKVWTGVFSRMICQCMSVTFEKLL